MKILLVEDTDDLRRLFARVLRSAGFEVLEAADGREALDCLPGFAAELVLTDLMMPVLGGLELIDRLRSMPAMDLVPILAMTAAATVEHQHAAIAAGAADILTKPIDASTLLASVGHLRR